MKYKSVNDMAREHISEHIKENHSPFKRRESDRFRVSLNELFSSEQRRLNKLLGVHAVNK